jgi:hypothetical protein
MDCPYIEVEGGVVECPICGHRYRRRVRRNCPGPPLIAPHVISLWENRLLHFRPGNVVAYVAKQTGLEKLFRKEGCQTCNSRRVKMNSAWEKMVVRAFGWLATRRLARKSPATRAKQSPAAKPRTSSGPETESNAHAPNLG